MRGVIFLAVGVLLFGGGVWALHRPVFLISNIVIEGEKALTEGELARAVSGELSGKYWMLFPKASVFLYPRQGIKTILSRTFPEIADVDVRRGDTGHVRIVVEERAPFSMWCGQAPKGKEIEKEMRGEDCYFVDASGVIFSRAPSFSNAVYLLMYGKVSSGEASAVRIHRKPIGYNVLPNDQFAHVIGFKRLLEGEGIVPEIFIAREEGGYEFVLENGVSIIFGAEKRVEEMMGDLRAALQTEVLAVDDLTEGDSTLEYVDVRFHNKVYYRHE